MLAGVKEAGFTDVRAPAEHGLETALKVHDAGYLEFLRTCWDRWQAHGFEGEAIATSFPCRRSQTGRVPKNIDGAVGYYTNSAETSISKGTYEAAIASMDVALSGADWLNQGNRFAFSLCRPPGHHAGIDLFGGYCFINNAAVAAQRLIDHGAKKSRSSTSTSTMATAPRTSPIAAATSSSPRCMASRKTPSPSSSVTPTRQARARARA